MKKNYKKDMYVRIKCIDGVNRIAKIIDIVEKDLFDYVGRCPYYNQLHWFKEKDVIEILEDFKDEQKNI